VGGLGHSDPDGLGQEASCLNAIDIGPVLHETRVAAKSRRARVADEPKLARTRVGRRYCSAIVQAPSADT